MNVPVLEATGLNKSFGALKVTEDVALRLNAGARTALTSEHSAFVAKPFTPELFTDRVRELLATAEAGAA